MAIPQNEVDAVRASTDIVALIGDSVALKRSGTRWAGLCPFHAEKSPSFSVNAEMGRYYCFGCHAKGDAFTWLMETQRIDFVDAIRQLADRAGIELHEDASAGPERKDRQEYLAAMDEAVKWYHERLLESPDARVAREYLKARGITGEVARKFQLGYAPDEWDALVKDLKLSEKVLTGTGLGFVNRRERKQDALRRRIIFPIFDPQGKAIAVGGRILPPTEAELADPNFQPQAKYKNSPETPIYSKRRTLYALNWAKDNIIKTGEVIVCEGYTDVIAFFEAGLPRAVATCGTALGEEHFQTMRNFAKRIVLAYDADAAGQNAAESVYQWEKKHEVDVAVARLPKGMDPAEFAQSDPEGLKRAIAEAVPFLQFRLERVLLAATLNTAEGKARAAEAALRVIAEHPNDLVRDQYVMEVADRLQIDVATLRPRLAEVRRGEKVLREVPNVDPSAMQRESVNLRTLPRPGVEALRLYLHQRSDVADVLLASYFTDPLLVAGFEALQQSENAAKAIEHLEVSGEFAAADVLAQLSVTDMARLYETADIQSLEGQLLRAAVAHAMKDVEREMREGVMAPEVAMATIKDVKERLALLDGPHATIAIADLRTWLQSRGDATRE